MNVATGESLNNLEIQEYDSITSRLIRACTPMLHKVPITNVRHKDNKILCDIDVSKLSTADKLLLGA